MIKTLLVITLTLALGCRGSLFTLTEEVEGEPTKVLCVMPFSFGQGEGPCDLEGGAISVPGTNLAHGVLCAALSWLGRTPTMCEPEQEAKSND